MPYSWDDDYDFDTSAKGGFSFHDARRSYDTVHIAKTPKELVYTFKSDFLHAEAKEPIIIGIDTTGSMAKWPRIFFEKLPLLYQEAVKYYPDCEISFQAINDYYADGPDVALQPAPFGKGPQLDEFIGQLFPKGGGGGQKMESYEIFAAYNSFLTAPRSVIKPIAVILGDEAPFDTVPPEVCRHYHLSPEDAVGSEDVFAKLHQVLDVFLVRKPYPGADDAIVEKWLTTGQMPPERILTIEDPRRVVDVILGIFGILTGKTDTFESELSARQTPEQTAAVLASLHKLSQHRTGGADVSQHSVTTGVDATASEKTKPLAIDADLKNAANSPAVDEKTDDQAESSSTKEKIIGGLKRLFHIDEFDESEKS